MSEKLKPCPFCGHEPYVFGGGIVKVVCPNCQASSGPRLLAPKRNQGLEPTHERRERAMKPTDEERRKVAQKLRDYERLRAVFMESNVCAFSDALDAGYLDWEQICARLADLIEPAPERRAGTKPTRGTSERASKHTVSCAPNAATTS